jgi:catechol 2,3-dioxygenase-like lactoylglutathione lyase family enzyme
VAILGINHIDLHSSDPTGLRHFYGELLAAEPLDGFHDPLRVGTVQLAFHRLEPAGAIGGVEIAFDADVTGYVETLARARQMNALDGDEVRWNDSARSFYVIDPDGRRIEISQHDPGVFWRA